LPNGESLETKDLDAVAQSIRLNRPRVFLFSCETARVENTHSFAKALLDRGAEAVVAPITKISADGALALFREVLAGSTSGTPTSLGDVFDSAVRRTGEKMMEVWVADNMNSGGDIPADSPYQHPCHDTCCGSPVGTIAT
jgi:hypothetical protein